MIWTPKNSKGMKLVDVKGHEIPLAYEFNDETSEVKFYLSSKGEGGSRHVACAGRSLEEGLEVVRASAIMKGAKMVHR